MKTLEKLYATHNGKLSDKWPIYLKEYDEKFQPYQDKKLRILEIGIQNGGSLEIYADYFPNAQIILGCDINENCKNLTYSEQNIQVIVGDATQNSTFEQIQPHGKFDIIIEDGSHTSPDIVKTFCKYFNELNEGGLFVIEDLHCSYWNGFTGGIFHPLSSISFFKRLVDIINFEHWGIEKQRSWLLKIFALNYGVDLDTLELESIHSIEFVNSVCFIKKKKFVENSLGKRIVVGKISNIDPRPIQLNDSTIKVDSQLSNPWSNRTLTPEEELIACKRTIKELQEKILLLENNQSNVK
jgi:hypothetical protein